MYSDDTSFCGIHRTASYRSNSVKANEGGGEVAIFSTQSWDHRSKEDLIEYRTLRDDAKVVGLYLELNPVRLTILMEKSEDYTTAPEHLQCRSLKLLMAKLPLISHEIFYGRYFTRVQWNLH